MEEEAPDCGRHASDAMLEFPVSVFQCLKELSGSSLKQPCRLVYFQHLSREETLRSTYLPCARCACSKSLSASSCEEPAGSSAGTVREERIHPERGGWRTGSCSCFLQMSLSCGSSLVSSANSWETTCRQTGLCWLQISELDWLVGIKECLSLAHLKPGEL